MCCALASQNVGVFRFTDGIEVYGNNEGIVSRVVTPVWKQIRTEDLGLIKVRIQEA